MRASQRCMLAATLLLLICKVAISHICKTFINMVDGLHTLFLVMHMALPAQTTDERASDESQLHYVPFLSCPPWAPYSLCTLFSRPPSPPLPSPLCPATPEPTPIPDSTQLSPSVVHSPPTSRCGLSYSHLRTHPVGALIATLLLASLCFSYLMEILGNAMQSDPMRHPLLATTVSAVSLLHNLLVLGLSQGCLRGNGDGEVREAEARSRLQANGKLVERTQDHTEPGCVVDEVQSDVDGSFHNGSLVLCNPGASSVPDSDCQAQTRKPSPQTQKPPLPVGHLHTPVPQGFSSGPGSTSGSQACEVVPSSTTDMKAYQCDSDERFTEKGAAKRCCMGRLDKQIAPQTDRFVGIPVPSAQWPQCVPAFILVLQTLLGSVLALTNCLVVLLLLSPECPSCSGLLYLDPALSLVALVVLLTIAVPQMYKYGLLLLQAIPPQVCVPELERRIASVPGVQALHDLHIWQLTDTYMVASVHVHCQAEFQMHRFGDLMSGVTKVLRSVGVSCCTIQPEFLPSSASTNSSLDHTSSSPPIIHREALSLPPLLACSLACGKDCASKMCCSPPEVETKEPLAPSGGETEEEPQMLVIENTFL